MPSETPQRREEDRDGGGLARRLDNLEALQESNHEQNRRSIHALSGGQQVIVDQIHIMKTDLEPWVGKLNLLGRINTNVEILTTDAAVRKGVDADRDKSTKGHINRWGLIISICAVIGTFLSPFLMNGCNHLAKAMLAPTVSQTTNAVDQDTDAKVGR